MRHLKLAVLSFVLLAIVGYGLQSDTNADSTTVTAASSFANGPGVDELHRLATIDRAAAAEARFQAEAAERSQAGAEYAAKLAELDRIAKQKRAEDAARRQAAQRPSRSAPRPAAPPVVDSGDMRSRILACIRSYEGAYSTNTGNGYYGAYQFDKGTWPGAVSRAGYGEYSNTTANNAPPHVQDAAAWQLYQERGLSPWPTPNRRCHPPNPRPKGS